MKKLLIITLLLWQGIAFANEAEHQRVTDALNAGNDSEAVAILESLAEQGDAEAQYWLGLWYEYGINGLPENKSKATQLYKKAYATWKPLAEQGDAEAQYGLGVLFEFGSGVPQSKKIAAKWYRLAAEQGHASAQTSLGYMYRDGDGVDQDYKEALKWYRLAAKQGNYSAQRNLGDFYANGHGVPQNDILTYMWYSLAETNQGSNAYLEKQLEKLAEKLTPAELEQAQELAEQCVNSGYKNCD